MVEGKLTEPCVSELELAWKQVRQASRSRHIVVDIGGVIRIDAKAEGALTKMIAEGARLTAKGLYCTYIVERLMNRGRKECARQDRQAGPRESSSIKESNQVGQPSPNKETK